MVRHALFLVLLPFTVAASSNTTKPLKCILEPSTQICLGYEWFIDGDANRNSSVRVAYRKQGQSQWKEYLSPLRIGGEKPGIKEWNYTTPHMFAGSIMDLEPSTVYEVRLTMEDPDGIEGQAVRSFTQSTRAVPDLSESGIVRHVYPFDWKGDKISPAYDGLLHAYFGYKRYADWILTTDPVGPGDKIVVHAGTYKAEYKDYRDFHGVTFDGTYFLTQDGTETQPIAIVAAGDGEVIFDGNDCAVLYDLTAADYHYVEGITFRNTEVAIRAGLMNAYGCDGLTVSNCRFEDIGIGIQGQYEGCKGYYIADNLFVGREDSTVTKNISEINGKKTQWLNSYYAIKLHGQGHTICYNKVKHFFDGIDICTHARPETERRFQSVSIDIYNNDLFLCNDNFIEADGGNYNIRIMRNRCFNSGQQALSNQPVLGGPVYWIRNIVYNSSDACTFKFWGMYPSGIIAYHNTSTGIFTRDDKPGSNVHLRNNLFLPVDETNQTVLGLYSQTSYSTLDYNGYRMRTPFIGYYAPSDSVRYDFSETTKSTRYSSLKDFSDATGQEKHGIEVDYDIFVNVPPPVFKEFFEKNKQNGRWYPVYYPDTCDFRLKKGAKAIDAGVVLAGINDSFTGKAPDLGAYESGKQIPHYGPRSK